jgi:hypothetical protein
MSPDKQNIAIAEACGVVSKDHWGALYKTEQGYARDCPDYLNDLNTMHEAEKSLDDVTQRGDYWDYLSSLTHEGFEMCHATAAQRAEAFLRTVGKWEEDK